MVMREVTIGVSVIRSCSGLAQQARALALALAVGAAGAGAVEARRLTRIYDERDVNYFLGVPVVALIPETLTPMEHSHARRQKFARVALVVIIVAASVPVVALLLNQSGLFEVLGNK